MWDSSIELLTVKKLIEIARKDKEKVAQKRAKVSTKTSRTAY